MYSHINIWAVMRNHAICGTSFADRDDNCTKQGSWDQHGAHLGHVCRVIVREKKDTLVTVEEKQMCSILCGTSIIYLIGHSVSYRDYPHSWKKSSNTWANILLCNWLPAW